MCRILHSHNFLCKILHWATPGQGIYFFNKTYYGSDIMPIYMKHPLPRLGPVVQQKQKVGSIYQSELVAPPYQWQNLRFLGKYEPLQLPYVSLLYYSTTTEHSITNDLKNTWWDQWCIASQITVDSKCHHRGI